MSICRPEDFYVPDNISDEFSALSR
ncbi:hypothetical protein A2U01_0092579, partial [Trifolium medium]|nr:hypothetical protein [Trifolium medium]